MIDGVLGDIQAGELGAGHELAEIVEREAFGVTHDEVGSRLAERWSLPEILLDVITNHHNPEQAHIDSELVHLIYIADLIELLVTPKKFK